MLCNLLKKTGAAAMAAAMVLNASAFSSSVVTAADAVKYEFEDGVITGTGSVKDDPDASGGQYKTDTKWIDSAQDADDIGLTVAEYIMLKEQYSDTALRADGVYDAYDAGIPVDVYLEAHDAMGDIKADKDANGNSISGSRKEKIIDYLNALGLTYEQYLYLLGTEYDTVKKTQDYISFFGSQK